MFLDIFTTKPGFHIGKFYFSKNYNTSYEPRSLKETLFSITSSSWPLEANCVQVIYLQDE